MIKYLHIVVNILFILGPTLLIINPYAYIDKLFNDVCLQ
jgi:hypothetical protein